jgi:hypothetical protein
MIASSHRPLSNFSLALYSLLFWKLLVFEFMLSISEAFLCSEPALVLRIECKLYYEAHPQSKFPWGRVQKQNTIAWKYLLQQIQEVFSFFSTYSPPELRHLSYRETNFCILCRRSLPPEIGTTMFWCQLLRHPPGAQFP